MYDLTNKQKECLIIINLFIKRKGYSPTIREIAKEMNINSPATVYFHLKELKKKGYVEWVEGQNRTIRVIKDK
jgi:repressor LexA